MTIKLFYEDEMLKITYLDNSNSSRCLIAFTGIGHAMGGINVQREEFFSQHALGMVIWITDKRRSWGNNLKVERISNAIKNLCSEREIFLIGNSMGGFLAILFSRALNARKVMAFVPQFSVSPNIVPTEKRWMEYRKGIKNIIYEDLSKSFSDDIDYVLLMGSGGAEEIHYQKFACLSQKPNLQLFKFLDATHNVAMHFKDLNILNQCIDVYFSNNSLNEFFIRNSVKFLSQSD